MYSSALSKIKILLVDADIHIAQVVMQNLRAMGFASVQHVRDSNLALDYMVTYPVDILVTEWVLEPLDGVKLVRHLRLSKESPNRGVPIIMLTGKGEFIDVQAARDVGITEFIVKPFTVQALYERIEHLIEHPRPFVMSKSFVGPDRRRRGKPPDGRERRVIEPKPTQKRGRALPDLAATPMVIPPDHELKRAIGMNVPLSTVITPAMLVAAQAAIDNMQEESLQWIREDLIKLENAYQKIGDGASAIEQLQEAALSIKSRAGTFGYVLPSVVARLLYLFLTVDYESENTTHRSIIQQSIQALKFMFAKGIKARGGVGEELLVELEKIIAKQKKA